ncbi:nucleotide-binding protein [Thiohalorhabdus sp.]|uniref:nucleotide-binding protein n=1 Tax=Thiohalorhabdus sp. TaxID=3094134 RepID=UPI002FC2EFC9
MITVIANIKGGSGKSTVAFNLGIWLEWHGLSVAAYDLDPQQTLFDVAQIRREEEFTPPFQVYQASEPLSQYLTHHPGEVLVDVGAGQIPAMRDAISVADRVLIPVPPSQADVWAAQRFLAMIREELSDQSELEIMAFINRSDTHHGVRESDETEAVLSRMEGATYLPERLAQRTVFRRSFSEGLAVFELERRSKAAREFNDLAQKLYPGLGPVRAKSVGAQGGAKG